MYDWNENALSLGRPDCMDTPTLIEWIQRQLETVEEIMDMRQVGEAFCSDCPDHEGCMQAAPCSLVKRVNKKE